MIYIFFCKYPSNGKPRTNIIRLFPRPPASVCLYHPPQIYHDVPRQQKGENTGSGYRQQYTENRVGIRILSSFAFRLTAFLI